MTLASRMIVLSKFFLLATYLVQAVQIFLFSVPSAGSTFEMLSKVRKYGGHSCRHPAGRILESRLKSAMMITATVLVALIFFLPLMAGCFPDLADYLGPLIPQPAAGFRLAGMLLLFCGNLVSTIAVCTLKRQVTFHAFGETRTLYTGGIYRRVRNPISLGSAAIYAGLFFYLPSVVMGVGFGLFMLNSELRIRMEEIYLERTFGDRYRHYKKTAGKYFPKIHS
jgi:protein-S-isoprenylcysteine O-methyltransferase Ste14